MGVRGYIKVPHLVASAQRQTRSPPKNPCPSSTNNNSIQQNNIKLGAGLGFTALGITGAIVAVNIVGFPETEVIELTVAGSLTVSGVYTIAATVLAGEPLGTIAVGESWPRFFGQVDKWNDCYIFPR